MKWKELEQYIQTHRDDLDVDTPRPIVWAQIERELDQKEKGKKGAHFFIKYPYWKMAAIILITVGICYVVFSQKPWKKPMYIAGHLTEQPLNERHEDYHPEFAEVETYYNMKVQQQLDAINQYDLRDFTFAEEFLEEMKQADDSYIELKKDIHEDGYNEQLIHGMIATYEQKIKILEDLLHQIQQSEQQEIPAARM